MDPWDIKPMLIRWIMSNIPTDALSVNAKQCLWIFLALQDAKHPNYFTDMKPPNVYSLWKPVAAVMQCLIYSTNQCRDVGSYDLDTDLDPEVAEKLMALVSSNSIL
jgi:hypothetical protein